MFYFNKKYALSTLLFFSLFFHYSRIKADSGVKADLQTLQTLASNLIKIPGQGLLTRIRNNTDYAADIEYIKTEHDKLPQGTTVRIKRADGMYLTCRKNGSTPKAAFEKCDAKDTAALWTVSRIKDNQLHDWLGLSHPNADGAFLGINQTSGDTTFIKKSFTQETDTAQQAIQQSIEWEIPGGATISNFFLKNHLNGGMLNQRTRDEMVPQGEDKKEIITALDTWYVKPINIIVRMGTQALCFIDEEGQFISYPPHWNEPILRIVASESPEITKIVLGTSHKRDTSELDSNTAHYMGNAATRSGIQVSNKRYVISHDDRKLYDWESQKFFTKEGIIFDGKVRLGDRLAIKSYHNTWLQIQENRYIGGDQATLFYIMPFPYAEPDKQQEQHIGFLTNGSESSFKGNVIQLAVANAKNIYGVSHTKNLFYCDGTNWQRVSTSFKVNQVSASRDGNVCCIDSNHKLWLKQNNAWSSMDGTWTVCAIRNANEIWLIDENGSIFMYPGSTANQFDLPNNTKAQWISVSDGGNVWALGRDSTIWRYDTNAKKWLLMPGAAKKIAVRSDTDVWVVGTDSKLYHYENSTWAAKNILATDIAVSSGITTNTILAPRVKTSITSVTSVDNDGKPFMGDAPSTLSIEIDTLGMGGSVGPKTSFDFSGIPAAQHPQVIGFAVDHLDSFDPTEMLNITPLLSKGVAWLDMGLPTPDRAGVSFMTQVNDVGDSQVLFGPQASNNFVYKVVLGGFNNTKSSIIKRIFDTNGDPQDITCYELTAEQSPIARITVGTLTPYWVSIDNGLIMAGKGDLGSNIFMAWRDPQFKQGMTRIGFGSNTRPVQYTNIVLTAPPTFGQSPKLYARSTLENNWAKDSFRVPGRGSTEFSVTGTENAEIILGAKKNSGAAHYSIVFGDEKNSIISIKKWDPLAKKYTKKGRIKLDQLPSLKLNTAKNRFWISFDLGQIIIGNGNLGSNPLYIYQDLTPISTIDSVFFRNGGTGSVAFSSLVIGEHIDLQKTAPVQSYTSTTASYKNTLASGGLTVILPVDYEFFQGDQVVQVTDHVLGQTYYLAGTPVQGTIYKFQITIDPKGFLALDWTTAPVNPTQLNIQRAALKVKNQAELQKITAANILQQGAIDQAAGDAKSATLEKKAHLVQDVAAKAADVASQAGAELAKAGNPMAVGIGAAMTAAGVAAGAAGVAASAVINNQAIDAANKGINQNISKQRDAANLSSDAAAINQEVDTALASSAIGQNSDDTYVFTDKPSAQAIMASQNPNAIALQNRNTISEIMSNASSVQPTTPDTISTLLGAYQQAIDLINQAGVLPSRDITLKNSIINGISSVILAYMNAIQGNNFTDLHQNAITLLLAAFNNQFLIDATNADDVKTQQGWYQQVTILARGLINSADPNDPHVINANKFFGEYIWLEDTFTTPGTGIITFEARGENIFVCFSPDASKPIRNSDTDLYEINIGGWDNTKTVMRIKSLDQYVKAITTQDTPNAAGDTLNFKQYWVSCNNGTINVGCGAPGKNTLLTWQDPYPNTKVRFIGLSSWNTNVEYRSISVLQELPDSIDQAAENADDKSNAIANLDFGDTIIQLANIIVVYEADANGSKPLSIDDAQKLESQGVDACMNGFNDYLAYSPDDITQNIDLIAQFQQDIENLLQYTIDDDHATLLTKMSDQITTDMTARDNAFADQTNNAQQPSAPEAQVTDQSTTAPVDIPNSELSAGDTPDGQDSTDQTQNNTQTQPVEAIATT